MPDPSETSILTVKRQLRARMRRRRAALADAAECSARIAEHVLALPVWVSAHTVMVYLAMDEEVDTEALIRAALAQGKRLCLPRLGDDDQMSAVHVTDLSQITSARTRLRIRQPAPGAGEVIAPAEIDLNLIPCVAADQTGLRLGLGGGHYDRLLPQTRADAVNLGLVFGCQVVDALPRESHDQRLTGLVSEDGVLWCDQGSGFTDQSGQPS